jgi:hypothetical protein
VRFLKTLCATAGLLALGATAFAQDITINYQLNFPVDTFNVHYTKGDGTTASSNQVPAGPFTATITNPTGFAPFTTYCVDLQHGVVTPTTAVVTAINVPVGNPADFYDPGTPGNGTPPADRLPGTFLELEEASFLIATNPVTTNDQGAALQAAIWAIVDGNTSFTVDNAADRFFITDDGLDTGPGSPHSYENFATVVSDANNYLAALQAQLALGGTHGLSNGILYDVDRTISTSFGQDMLRVPTTPEGASLLLFLPGLIPMAIGLRRRRSNKPSVE